ncbi:MAG TPA: riboflavin synthase [Puia sp.]|nr:riboflavin synthase [Puia sp.]
MFTGIIETSGIIKDIVTRGTNKTFWIGSAISGELKVDQSVSHNGVCLTVEEVKNNVHRVTAIKETLDKTNLKHWKKEELVNLERCLIMNGRLDGHIVQGHVDTTAICTEIKPLEGSYELTFEFPKKFSHLIIEKGSISLNGISLTVFNAGRKKFSVAIIPYTFEHTNIKNFKKGTIVNIEFDMIGKYVQRIQKFA